MLDGYTGEIIAAVAVILASLGGGLCKLIFDGVQNKKIQAELLRITKAKVKHDQTVARLRIEREQALDDRNEAYDAYDTASKTLVLVHAKLYEKVSAEQELTDAILEVTRTKDNFKSSNRAYFDTLRRINAQILTAAESD